MPADLDFECDVNASALGPWAATGMDVPESVRARFGLWMAMDDSAIPPALSEACKNPPSGGDYSPVQGPGSGGVSRADVVVALEPVTVYRTYTGAPFECSTEHPAGEFGSWWSPVEPQLPKDSYAKSVGVCPAWNDMSMMITCTLAPGTVVLVGPTQSATCAGSSSCDPAPAGWDDPLPATTAPQLFINTYSPAGKRSDAQLEQFLTGCESAHL